MSRQKITLNREKIAAAALAIADRHGFEAVTMRQVAHDLKVGTMSLYYYVKAKNDLIAAMDDALMGELLLPSVPKDWRRALLKIAHRTRQMFIRHPWALIAMLSAVPGVNAMRHMEQCLEALAGTRMSNRQKITLLALVDDFVFGHALREAAVQAPIDPEVASASIKPANFPRLADVFGHGYVEPDKERFQKGLEALFASVTEK